MDGLFGISRSLYGQPWTNWSSSKELENEEETPDSEQNQPAADVMRLPKEDMTLFGFCPEQDDFYIVICELCGLGIKPMGMNHHMTLRHSQGDDIIKTSTLNKTLSKESENKPKNRKHVSATNLVSNYGVGEGPQPKEPPAEPATVNAVVDSYNEAPLRPPPNSKIVKIDDEKKNKISGTIYNTTQKSHDANLLNGGVHPKFSSSKSSKSSKSIHVDIIKPSKTPHKAVPIKSGFRLQLVDSSNRILFKKNSRSVLNATSELKVRHRRKHKRSRTNKKASKIKNTRKTVPILPKVQPGPSPIVAPCPSLAPSPYVALTPLKYLKWNNVIDGSHLKANRNLFSNVHPVGGASVNVNAVHVLKSEDSPLQRLTIDTSSNSELQPELRVHALSCRQHATIRTQPEGLRMNHCHVQRNNVLLPAVLPNTPIRVPDIAWSTVHPKPLGVCPMQTRKVGGLITTDRRLDSVWQSMKSALLEHEAYQTTVLCSASSSQSDFHLNHKSSIKTILASLAANNYGRNSVCKAGNSNLRQFPIGINNEKPSLTSVIDVSSSVMLISSNNSKYVSNSSTFLSHITKAAPVIKQNPPNTTSQPYPGIFLRNGHYILPRHFRICLKRRRAIPVVNNVAKKLKEIPVDDTTGNSKSSPNEHCFPRSVPIVQFPISNGLLEQANNYINFPEEELKKIVPQNEIELDVVNSISMLTSNGENLCENAGRLSELDQLKNNFMSGFHGIKTASRIMDVSNKSSCRKAASSTLPNVRISSTPGTVQVNTPQITYLTAGPVTFQQITPQMIGQIQLQSKPNQSNAPLPLKLISPAQSVSLTTSRTLLLQPEKDES